MEFIVQVVAFQSRSARVIALSAFTALALTVAGCTAAPADGDGPVEIDILTPSTSGYDEQIEEVVAAFMDANPEITVNIVYQPGGAEGDNLIKTKLATNEMEDVFLQATGAQMQGLKPDKTLVDLTDEPWISDIDQTFINVVDTDNGIYGAPYGTMMGGVVLYNKPIYEELGLAVPLSWEDFMANNQAIKDAGIVPIIQTYAATWTSQLFVLGDFANVSAQDPDWAEKFTANEVKTAEQPAVQAWINQQEAYEAGFFNADFASATFDDGMRMLALGEGAHYPMLSGALGTLIQNFPDKIADIGGFAFPAQDADDTTLTVWPPAAWYIPASTEGAQLAAAKKFLAFVVSPEGCNLQNEFGTPNGPHVITSCELPDTVAPILLDMQQYFDAGNASPALEFISPIKGPNLEFITVEVGSGIRSGEDGAALYDEDVKKQAQQLGLEGW